MKGVPAAAPTSAMPRFQSTYAAAVAADPRYRMAGHAEGGGKVQTGPRGVTAAQAIADGAGVTNSGDSDRPTRFMNPVTRAQGIAAPTRRRMPPGSADTGPPISTMPPTESVRAVMFLRVSGSLRMSRENPRANAGVVAPT